MMIFFRITNLFILGFICIFIFIDIFFLLSALERLTISRYLLKMRELLFKSNAPGSLFLRIENIANGELFIPPEWAIYPNRRSENELIQYLLDSINKNKSILLLGEAGQGKTITTLFILYNLTESYNIGSIKKIPIYIPLSSLIDSFRTSSNNGTEAELYKYLRENSNNPIPMTESTFARKLKSKKFIFLFDGFDELFNHIDQKDIVLKSKSNLFNQLSILTCRINFYENFLIYSAISETYIEKVQMLPLDFDSIKEYVPKYFSIMRREHNQSTSAIEERKLLELISSEGSIFDLARRPLLLMMILDVFADPRTQGDLIQSKNNFGITQLYKMYTEKWLDKESQKPPSILKWEEKDKIVEKLAWELYSSATPSSSTYGQTTMGFDRNNLLIILEKSLNRFRDVSKNDIIDDICLRSFLIRSYNDKYSFIHKSFFEYYVAKHIYSSLKINWKKTRDSLLHSTPNEIARFIEEFLFTCGNNQEEVLKKIESNLKTTYLKSNTHSLTDQIIREHACYYLSCLSTPTATDFIKDLYMKESDKLPQRGMIVGLIVHCHDMEIVNKYVKMLEEDNDVAQINLAYMMAYYGDMPLSSVYENIDRYDVNNTLRNCITHLDDEKHRFHWAIDLFTLRYIASIRGIELIEKCYRDSPSLNKFFKRTDLKAAVVLDQEKKLLKVLNK